MEGWLDWARSQRYDDFVVDGTKGNRPTMCPLWCAQPGHEWTEAMSAEGSEYEINVIRLVEEWEGWLNLN